MRAAAVILSVVYQVCLSVWLGGAVVLGAVGAPVVFRLAREQGQTHQGMPLYDFAGRATGTMFGRFNWVVLVCGALLLLTGCIHARRAGLCVSRTRAQLALTGLAWLIAAWVTFGLYPQMVTAREAGQMAAFDAMHHTYTTAFSAQVLLLLTGMVLTAWMQLDGSVPESARAATARPGMEQRAVTEVRGGER